MVKEKLKSSLAPPLLFFNMVTISDTNLIKVGDVLLYSGVPYFEFLAKGIIGRIGDIRRTLACAKEMLVRQISYPFRIISIVSSMCPARALALKAQQSCQVHQAKCRRDEMSEPCAEIS